MSTIENILTSLHKTSADKKAQLNSSYQEKSVWLRNEFDVIRKLIKQNPRENLSKTEEVHRVSSSDVNDTKMVPFHQLTSVGAKASAPSSSQRCSEDSTGSRKRKSLDRAANASVNLSPEQKRGSFGSTTGSGSYTADSPDMAELLAKAGLPSDLNRLKKEQLLAELEQLGAAQELSMKSLKKELIDALRDALVTQNKQELQATVVATKTSEEPETEPDSATNCNDEGQDETGNNAPSEMQDAEAEDDVVVADDAAMDTAAGAASAAALTCTPGKSARKGSLMAEFRTLVHRQSQAGNSTAATSADGNAAAVEDGIRPSRLSQQAADRDDPQWRQRIETEHHARQSRHRDSQLRKSQQLPTTTVTASQGSKTLPTEAPIKTAAASGTGAPTPSGRKRGSLAGGMCVAPPASSSMGDTMGSQASVGSAVELNAVDLCTTGDAALPPVPAAVPMSELGSSADQADSDEASPSAPGPQVTTVADNGGSNVWSEVASEAPTSPVRVSESSSTRSSSVSVNSTASAAARAPHTKVNGAAAGKSTASVKPSITKQTSGGLGAKMTAASVAKTSSSTIPSLKKAMLAKQAEEARLLQKKKDAEARAAASAANGGKSGSTWNRLASAGTKSSSHATAKPTAPTAGAAPTAPATSVTALPVSSAPAAPVGASTPTATEKKKGIFGLFSGNKTKVSKQQQPAPQAAAAPPTAPPAAPIASNATASELTATSAPSTAARQPGAAVGAASGAVAGVKLKDGFASKSLISNIVQNYNNACKVGNTAAHQDQDASVVPPAVPAAAVQEQAVPPPPPVVPTSPKVRSAAITSSSNTAAAAVAAGMIKPVLSKAPTSVICASSGVLKDITASAALASIPAKVQLQQQELAQQEAAAAAARQQAEAAAKPVTEYVIEDRESSDEESGSGTDDEEQHNKKAQSVPDWARGSRLKEALERQYGLVPGVPPMDPDLIFHEVQTCNLEEIFGCKQGINRKYAARSSSAHWEPDQLTLVEKRTYRKHMGYDRHAAATGNPQHRAQPV